MADGRRLEDEITGIHDEGCSLALVGEAHPAGDAVDALKVHKVEVRIVGHRATSWDANGRRDQRSATTAHRAVASGARTPDACFASSNAPAASRRPRRYAGHRACRPLYDLLCSRH